MPHRTTSAPRSELASRFQDVRAALAVESPGALDRMAALAVQALDRKELLVAAASAGMAVLVEHLEWAVHRQAPRMLAILGAVGHDAASAGADGLYAWAGAAVAHDYGVLPSWPAADIGMLMERAQHAPNDAALALGCALGEVCERNGKDAEFAALQAQMSGVEVQPGVSPFWRGHWSIACAWHLHSFGKMAQALQRLEMAQALAAAHGLTRLGATAGLQRARLIECRRAPAKAVALAEQAVAHGDPAQTPLWWADQADVHSRIALNALDFHAAVGHARRAVGYTQAAGVWPGYQLAYRASEAYGLLGTGAIDEALARRLLGHDGAISVHDRRVRLNGQFVWVDTQALNDRLTQGESAVQGSAAAGAALEAALALYRGPFLSDSKEDWAVAARERLRTRLAAVLLRTLRSAEITASQSREWTLRVTSADPRVAQLIKLPEVR